jgi:hypothetical protein
MALIEYDIQYDDKTESSKVICRILTVGGPGPDKIRFKSNDLKTAIEYEEQTPFDHSDTTAPQPNKVFSVGKETKEFDVVRSVTREKPFHFKCGEGVPTGEFSQAYAGGEGGGTGTTHPTQKTNGSTLTLKLWEGSGGDTPPPDI